MIDSERTFAVASDEALVELISGARTRLVVIAPALTKAVAHAVARRLRDLGPLSVTVVLDADPEVYRLGFGDLEALDAIRAASDTNHFDLREQPGIRIGVVIADGITMVYSPVSKNIEAGSISAEKPNAILLSGSAGDRVAIAAGADTDENAPKAEVGNRPLAPAKVQEMLSDLKGNPPKPFDITRKMNIFTSRVQYVEFSASNYQLTTRQIPLPAELVDIGNDSLKKAITGRIRAPFEDIGKLEITIETEGKSESINVDDNWLKKERKRIEDEYTFQINNFGRVILFSDRDEFDKSILRFKMVIETYRGALRAKLSGSSAAFEEQIIDEFLPRWQDKHPKRFARYGLETTPDNMRMELRSLARQIWESAIGFEEPRVKVLYKNVAPETIYDPAFVEVLKTIMVKRGVPLKIIRSLFEAGQAAPESGAFTGQ
jgi:hypothetical protein